MWELQFDKLPEDRWRIATERVKWSGTYQKKYGITSGPASDLPDDSAEQICSSCASASTARSI